jgi:type VI protein secretion system component VasF
MIEHDPGSGLHPDPLEQRLRDALRARADSVDLFDLRPAAPPSAQARFRLPVTRPVRRTVVALFVVAAVVVGFLFVAVHWERETPVSPANIPSVTPTPDVVTAVPWDEPGTAVPNP